MTAQPPDNTDTHSRAPPIRDRGRYLVRARHGRRMQNRPVQIRAGNTYARGAAFCRLIQ